MPAKKPKVGLWYAIDADENQLFKVVEIDESLESIVIHFSDGYADEIDYETWSQWSPHKVDASTVEEIEDMEDFENEEDYSQILDTLTESIEEDTTDSNNDSFAA